MIITLPTYSELIQFLSDNFESFAYIAAAILIMIVVVFVTYRIRVFFIKTRLSRLIFNVLSSALITAEVIMGALLGVVYWHNYQNRAADFEITKERIKGPVKVERPATVYFINENEFCSIRIDGSGFKSIFKSREPIREYQFSPDGRYVLVAAYTSLYLLDRADERGQLIEDLKGDGPQPAKDLNGAISGILFSPDSTKFFYELSRWSSYARQDNMFVYSIADATKTSVASSGRKISSDYWDPQSRALYYFYFEAKDTERHAYPYEVSLYTILLATMQPQLVMNIPARSSDIPWTNLAARGISLYTPSEQLIFSRTGERQNWISDAGAKIGIDQDDYLYFIKNKWFHKRLFKIARLPGEKSGAGRLHSRGELATYEMRWIPGSRYVIIGHSSFGVLILDPFTGKLARLSDLNGRAFGWYKEK